MVSAIFMIGNYECSIMWSFAKTARSSLHLTRGDTYILHTFNNLMVHLSRTKKNLVDQSGKIVDSN